MRTGRKVLAIGAVLGASLAGSLGCTTVCEYPIAKAKEKVRVENARILAQAREEYRKDHGALPANESLLVTERYIRAIPVDPQ